MAIAATLVARLKADTKDFNKKFKSSRRQLSAFNAAAGGGIGTLLKYGAVIGGVVAGAVVLLVKKQAAAIDVIAKTSDKLGIQTDKLVSLQLAGELTGVSIGGMNKAIQTMLRQVSDAARGTGEAKDALNLLGVSAKDLVSLSPDQQFAKIGEAMKGIKNPADRVAIAMDIFGRQGASLINTLNLSGDAFKQIASDADTFGLSLSRGQAKGVENMNDSMTLLSSIVTGFGRQITIGLAPIITKLTDKFVNWARQSGGVANFVAKGFDIVLDAIAKTIEFVNDMRIGWQGWKITGLKAIESIVEKMKPLLDLFDAADDRIRGKKSRRNVLLARSKEFSAAASEQLSFARVQRKAGNAAFAKQASSIAKQLNLRAQELAAKAQGGIAGSAIGNIKKAIKDAQAEQERLIKASPPGLKTVRTLQDFVAETFAGGTGSKLAEDIAGAVVPSKKAKKSIDKSVSLASPSAIEAGSFAAIKAGRKEDRRFKTTLEVMKDQLGKLSNIDKKLGNSPSLVGFG